MNKICTKCKKNKALEDYYKDVQTKDGRKSKCKSCINIMQKEYSKTNKGKLTQAKYTKSDKGKLRDAKASAKYNKTEKGRLTNARYKKSDKGKLTSTKARAKYFKTNKGKLAKARAEHNRRTDIENTLNTLTDKEFNCILFLQNYKCANPNCESGRFFDEVEPQKDHINPVSKGGDFTKETVQALCKSCDSKKGIKYIDFRTEIHKEMIKTI